MWHYANEEWCEGCMSTDLFVHDPHCPMEPTYESVNSTTEVSALNEPEPGTDSSTLAS